MLRLFGLAFGSVVLMAVIAMGLAGKSPEPADPKPQAAASAGHAQGDELELVRDGAGRFHLDAEVNGSQARFLLDTGADIVALTLEDAERLGVEVDADNLQPVAQTASGVGYGALVKIDRVTVAGQEFRDVDAVVIEGLGMNLLGRSLIARLGTLEMQGERMVLRRS